MIPLKKNLRFKPAQKCIYCDKIDVKLSREHIVPRSLGGTWILPAASCEECRDITSKFELSVAREMYIVLRTKNNFPTGHPENRPKYFEVNIEKSDGSQERIEIHQSKYPTLYPVLYLPPPGILSGAELSDMSPAGMELVVVGNQNEMNAFAQEYPNAKISTNLLMWSDFFKMLAKIAHGLTVALCGTVGYTPLLPSLILGKYPYLSNLVGGADKSDHVIRPAKVNEPYLMKLDGYEIIFDSKGYVIVNINIMDGRCPTYTVVSGHINDWNAFMTNTSHIKQEGKKEFAHGMRTRFMFIHEWTSWIVQIIRHYVAQDYPNFAKQWPLLAGYSFDAYALPPTHYL